MITADIAKQKTKNYINEYVCEKAIKEVLNVAERNINGAACNRRYCTDVNLSKYDFRNEIANKVIEELKSLGFQCEKHINDDPHNSAEDFAFIEISWAE